MNWLKTFTAATSMLVASLSFADVGPWELEAQDEDKDISVFTRTVDGSPLKEFKGVTHIKTDVSAFVALLRDTDSATDWMHNVKDFKVMTRPSDTENVVYTVNNTPWPVTDRDAYIRSVMTATATGAVTSSLTAEPEFKEANEDYIRMPELKGSWVFTPQAEGMVEVVYQVHANPGGSLPDWLVNTIVVETPMNTLSNLQEIVVKDKYQGQTFAFIEEAIMPKVVAEEKMAEPQIIAGE
jgi:hypothetical protein